MRVRYRHTYTVTVTDIANFGPTTTLEQIKLDSERNARIHKIMVATGGQEPRPVVSQSVTATSVDLTEETA